MAIVKFKGLQAPDPAHDEYPNQQLAAFDVDGVVVERPIASNITDETIDEHLITLAEGIAQEEDAKVVPPSKPKTKADAVLADTTKVAVK